MKAELCYRSYRWRGGDEWLAEIGSGPPILLVPPLLEELNRCRAFLAAIMRGLAAAGFRAVLPDLPGTGESPRDLSTVGLDDWTGAVGLLSFDLRARSQVPLLASFRGGCLIEAEADVAACWRFAPVAGTALTRDLVRARQAILPDKTRSEAIIEDARNVPTEFSGYRLPSALFAALHDARPHEADGVRTVRLTSDPAPADLKLDGRPLWRQAEPGTDADLSSAIAADIATWARTCAA